MEEEDLPIRRLALQSVQFLVSAFASARGSVFPFDEVWGFFSSVLGEAAVTSLFFVNLGGITGAIEISITYPTEFTKTVMQLDRQKQ